MKRNLFYALVLLGIVSCTKEEQRPEIEKDPGPKVTNSSLTVEEAERFVLLNTDYTVSKADLLIQAQALAESFGKEEANTKGHKVSRIAVISDSIVPAAGQPGLTERSRLLLRFISFHSVRMPVLPCSPATNGWKAYFHSPTRAITTPKTSIPA